MSLDAHRLCGDVWLRWTLRSLVTMPDRLQVEAQDGPPGRVANPEAPATLPVVMLTVTVPAFEVGHVLGRQGRTITAIRRLLEVIGVRDRVLYRLRVITTGGLEVL